MRCIIVDDEAPARQIVRDYLEDYPSIQVVAECVDGWEALREIEGKAPHLVFLDIQMPGLIGFEVLDQLSDGNRPAIVFSTAHDEHAIRAFEVNAVDYLLKPYDRKRFGEAVSKVLTTTVDWHQLTSALAAFSSSPSRPSRLLVRDGKKVVFIAPEQVTHIEAAGDYSKIHVGNRYYLSAQGIGALAGRLDPEVFLRVHRSTIVALTSVERLDPDSSGGFTAVLKGGTEIRVSRSFAGSIKGRIL